MNSTRHDFLKGALAALGFSALPGGLFAAPKGWKIKKKPNLVFGILSDTHLQSGWDGVTPHRGFPLTYVINAMKLFRSCNIDAFMHLGDMAHRGKNVEVQFTRNELKKVIGEPQFGKKAKLEVKFEKKVGVGERNNSALELELKTPAVLRIKIPLADGNPESRVFAYDVVIVGEDRKKRLFKSVYFEGCNVAPGHEPNNGMTEVEIPVAELPAGKNLTIAIRPISSLGTKGKSIGTTIRV